MFRLKITVIAIFTEIYSFRLNAEQDKNVVQDTKCHTGQSFIQSFWGTILVGRIAQQGKPCRLLCYSAVGTCNSLFLILTWKLVNRGITQTKKTSNWVAENPTEYIFFNKILWFMMSNSFCKLIRTILLWPFVLHPTGLWLFYYRL